MSEKFQTFPNYYFNRVKYEVVDTLKALVDSVRIWFDDDDA